MSTFRGAYQITDGEGSFRFPESSSIEAQKAVVVARSKESFYKLYGKYPDFSGATFSLANSGDEVILTKPDNTSIDVVVYEKGNFPGVAPHPGIPTGHSLEREFANIDTDDCSKDFIDQSLPNPGVVKLDVSPAPATNPPIDTSPVAGDSAESFIGETSANLASYLLESALQEADTNSEIEGSNRVPQLISSKKDPKPVSLNKTVYKENQNFSKGKGVIDSKLEKEIQAKTKKSDTNSNSSNKKEGVNCFKPQARKRSKKTGEILASFISILNFLWLYVKKILETLTNLFLHLA